MDSENRYLIDQKGGHIQLDEKHMRLLEQHRILQKWPFYYDLIRLL